MHLFLFIPLIADYLGPAWLLTISFAIELAPYLCLLTFLGLARIVAISNSQETRVAQSALLELLVLLPGLAMVLLVNKIQLVPTVMIISVSSALLMMIFSIQENIMIGRRLGYSIAITISAIALTIGDLTILFVLLALFSLCLLIKIKRDEKLMSKKGNAIVLSYNVSRYVSGNYHQDLITAAQKLFNCYVYGPGIPRSGT